MLTSKRGRDTFLDLSPVETLTFRQRLSRSRPLQAALLLALVAGVVFVVWYTVWRVDLPSDLSQAIGNLDQAMSDRDSKLYLAAFPPEAEIVLDGQGLSRILYSDRISKFLQAKEVEQVEQTSSPTFARVIDDNTIEVRVRQEQSIKMTGKDAFQRRLLTTMVWGRTTTGWVLKSFRSKSLRVVP